MFFCLFLHECGHFLSQKFSVGVFSPSALKKRDFSKWRQRKAHHSLYAAVVDFFFLSFRKMDEHTEAKASAREPARSARTSASIFSFNPTPTLLSQWSIYFLFSSASSTISEEKIEGIKMLTGQAPHDNKLISRKTIPHHGRKQM